jgi:hypothetical protein
MNRITMSTYSNQAFERNQNLLLSPNVHSFLLKFIYDSTALVDLGRFFSFLIIHSR